MITHLPPSCGHDTVFTIVDHFSKYITFVPCYTSNSAFDLLRFSIITLFVDLACLKELLVIETAGFYLNFGKITVVQGGFTFGIPPIDWQLVCKFRGILYKLTSQYGLVRLYIF